MSGLENMKTRIQYAGGKTQVERMNEDKLRTVKRALLYSYQSATAILADGREFRCLINPDQIKNEYDNKILSIPFEDICLKRKEEDSESNKKEGTTTEGIEQIGIKPGDVFTWKENSTDWIVYLQSLEETAYFRAEIRRCKYTTEINGITYKVYAGDHSLDGIDWNKSSNKTWNDLDYQLSMYITKDENTESYLHRFAIVKLNGKPWEVQAVDSMSSDGIILVWLKEYYQNSIEEEIEKEDNENNNGENNDILEGDLSVYPYDTKKYFIINDSIFGGIWKIDNNNAKIINQTDKEVEIFITSSKSGNFNLIYSRDNEEDIVFAIKILSL